MEKEVFLTKEGYDKLKREYDELSSTGRKEMAEKIKIAREFGDLSENAEYDAAKEEQGFLEKRIREINEMLSNCTIIDESTIDTKTVSVGCIVKLQDLEFGDKLEYKIVGVSEAKIEENLISNESPLGSALIGKKKGQEVVVTTPGGEARFKILSINAQEVKMAENDVRNNEQQEDLSELIKVRRDKLRDLQDAGKDPFKEVRFDKTAMSKEIVDNFEKYEGKTVSLAGRLVSKRVMGKASFAHILDGDGQIQLYFKRDVLGDEPYAEFKKYDIGDIIGVTGEVFVTHMGETTVNVTSVKLLSKSLLPLPEKFHGLTNTDLRYRQRYVDLIVNPEVKSVFVKRSMVLREIRNFLDEKGYLEVETPVLHNIAGGANARPFITHHNTLDIDMYLRIALELYLKRLIVGGFEKVYEIGRVFRNEGMDQRHNPEFTLLELYEAYTDIHGMMDITEGMFRHVANKVCGTGKITFDGVDLDLDKPFERISMVEAVRKYAGVDFDKIETLDEARAVAKEHHIEYEQRHKKGDILNLFIEAYVEDKLVQPTFLTGHPVEISPLAKRDPDHPGYTQRFELFINGREYANAFSELNDPIDQRGRFEAQAELKKQGDEEANDIDEDYLTAMEYGMPPTGGLGVGVDRLVMLVTGAETIRDVLLFPTMKPIKK